jgi:hypothetical protein
MRPRKHKLTGSNDLFRARLDQIINMKHELVLLAGKIDWDWIDGEIAPLYSEQGRPGIETRFMIGLFLLKQIYGLSDEGGVRALGPRAWPAHKAPQRCYPIGRAGIFRREELENQDQCEKRKKLRPVCVPKT